MLVSYKFQLVMSLPAMSLGLRFCKGQGGFQPWAQVTWLLPGIDIESPGPALGGHGPRTVTIAS